MSGKVTVIHWFRKGLRVHDNPALVKAVDEAINRKVCFSCIFKKFTLLTNVPYRLI